MLLGGCSKPYWLRNEKNVPYPQETRSGIHYVNDGRDLSRVAWWKKLHDPKLDRLISQALLVNNEIKSANATILEAQAQLKAAQYVWLPTLDGNANGFTAQAWNTHIRPQGSLANNPLLAPLSRPFAQASSLKFRAYSAGFVPSYTVNILNNWANIQAAEASLGMKQALAQSTKLSIISQMSGTYFILLSQREQLRLEKALQQDLKELRQLEKRRYKSGASDIEAILNVDQELAEEEARIPLIENTVAQSENTIHLLLNQNPGPIRTDRSLLSFNPDSLIPKNLPSSVLKNRPDLMLALSNLKMADAQLGIAYSAFFPTISLTSLLGKASIDLTHLLKLSTNLWIAEAIASTKILNASAYQTIKAAKAGFCASYYDYLQTLRAIFADVDNSLTNHQKNRSAYLQIERAYVAAKRAYAIVLTQYKAGAKDYRNVVNAKINLDRSRLSLVQQKTQLMDSLVQLYNAVAGGYCVA